MFAVGYTMLGAVITQVTTDMEVSFIIYRYRGNRWRNQDPRLESRVECKDTHGLLPVQ